MEDLSEREIRQFLEEIYLRYHQDFRSYEILPIRRRLVAALAAMQCGSLSVLKERVLDDPRAFSHLLQQMTVPVSDMFRDPGFFAVLREQIVPVLRTYPSLKVWVAGCSTGEELYSFAIVLHEEQLLERTILYATDINPEALRKAESGVYAIERLSTFSERYRLSGGKGSLSEYYSAAYGAASFDRSLRKNVVFSDHSLATDSVFAEVQVVSCRNVLIYFDRALQERALSLVKDALSRRGFLGLGSKETLQFSSQAGAFRPVSPEQRWYQRC